MAEIKSFKPRKEFIFPYPESDYANKLSEMEFRRMRRREGQKVKNGGIPEFIYGNICMSDIVRATGYTLSGISRIMNGHRSPRWETACDIVDFIKSKYPEFGLDTLRQVIHERKHEKEKDDQAAEIEETNSRYFVGKTV